MWSEKSLDVQFLESKQSLCDNFIWAVSLMLTSALDWKGQIGEEWNQELNY